MLMYGVFVRDKLYGINEDINVCKKYLIDIFGDKSVLCGINKINKKDISKYSDLYLVKYGDSYIQLKYYDLANTQDKIILNDYTRARDVLLSLITILDDKKEQKHVQKTILILNKLITKNKGYIDPDVLEQIETMHQDFLNIINN